MILFFDNMNNILDRGNAGDIIYLDFNEPDIVPHGKL